MTKEEAKALGATHYSEDSFYRYNHQNRQYELYLQGIGWVGVLLGYSTKLKPL